MATIGDLPLDAIAIIVSNLLDAGDFARARRVCKAWYRLMEKPFLAGRFNRLVRDGGLLHARSLLQTNGSIEHHYLLVGQREVAHGPTFTVSTTMTRSIYANWKFGKLDGDRVCTGRDGINYVNVFKDGANVANYQKKAAN